MKEEEKNWNDGSDHGNILKYIAELCIKKRWKTAHSYTKKELKEIHSFYAPDCDGVRVEDGYCYWESDHNINGVFIRLYAGQCNPKYFANVVDDEITNIYMC
mmetsp:Transcript_25146/g.28980  ORF Transcript_25146/g.28980 Transcript_25146/m.28980 type:complete len:102 (-) Transcript_25146:44-349(-)